MFLLNEKYFEIFIKILSSSISNPLIQKPSLLLSCNFSLLFSKFNFNSDLVKIYLNSLISTLFNIQNDNDSVHRCLLSIFRVLYYCFDGFFFFFIFFY
jgi:hypothetical protein